MADWLRVFGYCGFFYNFLVLVHSFALHSHKRIQWRQREGIKRRGNTIKNIWNLYSATQTHSTILQFWVMTACRELKHRLLLVALFIPIPKRNSFASHFNSFFLSLFISLSACVCVTFLEFCPQYRCRSSARSGLFTQPFSISCKYCICWLFHYIFCRLILIAICRIVSKCLNAERTISFQWGAQKHKSGVDAIQRTFPISTNYNRTYSYNSSTTVQSASSDSIWLDHPPFAIIRWYFNFLCGNATMLAEKERERERERRRKKEIKSESK